MRGNDCYENGATTAIHLCFWIVCDPIHHFIALGVDGLSVRVGNLVLKLLVPHEELCGIWQFNSQICVLGAPSSHQVSK